MSESKTDIRDLSLEQLEEVVLDLGEKKFRAKQIQQWLWEKGAASFEEMSSLSKNFREKLEEHFNLNWLTVALQQKSKDGTRKIAFRLYDNELIESVIIPSGDRLTGCISSQVGCSFRCSFCATGHLKYKRNLSVAEIFGQVAELNKICDQEFNTKLSNIVLMGMGEPLVNYNNVLKAMELVSSKSGLGMSPQRVTLSTVGLVDKIRQLADDGVRFNLAISLHTADPIKRLKIMPITRSNPLNELSKSIRYFHKKTGKRITFEYLLLKDFNDTVEDAAQLAEFTKVVPCKVNLIEYNPTDNSPFGKPNSKSTQAFKEFLENKNLIVQVRQSKGDDIDAACGQLANKNN